MPIFLLGWPPSQQMWTGPRWRTPQTLMATMTASSSSSLTLQELITARLAWTDLSTQNKWFCILVLYSSIISNFHFIRPEKYYIHWSCSSSHDHVYFPTVMILFPCLGIYLHPHSENNTCICYLNIYTSSEIEGIFILKHLYFINSIKSLCSHL